MNRFSTILRLSIGLAFLSVSIVAGAASLGLIPDWHSTQMHQRKSATESLAVHCATIIQHHDPYMLKKSLPEMIHRFENIASIGIRTNDGTLLVSEGEHEGAWQPQAADQATPTQMQVPLSRNGKPWGSVEVRFQPLKPPLLARWIGNPFYALLIYVGLVSALSFGAYLFVMYLRSSRKQGGVIPQRVRTALDTLTEGVIILDGDKRIAMANEAFAHLLGRDPAELRGKSAEELPWLRPATDEVETVYPWDKAQQEGCVQRGMLMSMQVAEGHARTVAVNSAPIMDDDGRQRGSLATFDDLTEVEKKNVRLVHLLDMLKESRQEIEQQNENLKFLATRDSLTGCLNRRTFFEEFDAVWSGAVRHGVPVSCVMVDLDHFKSINDNYGHAKGDAVLKCVAEALREVARKSDFVCRYGGEEFSVLLPHIDLEGAMQCAERFRQIISELRPAEIDVTASLGVSSTCFGARQPAEMLDQADKALYVAKRGGRNRVAKWDEVPRDLDKDPGSFHSTQAPKDNSADEQLPFHSVTVLLSALSLRHADTAEHSQRVAQHCVNMAHGLLSQSETRVLESAALLHDIGKLGVPDAVLLKPAPLTVEEWAVMRTHDRYSVDVVAAAFGCPRLNCILQTHFAWYGGHPEVRDLPMGRAIPVESRILAVCDAYDAIVSDRVYRKGRPREVAFSELRRCAGTQFDPEMVERFILLITDSNTAQRQSDELRSAQGSMRIGALAEKLATAVESRDGRTLSDVADEIELIARDDGMTKLADQAQSLGKAAQNGENWESVVKQSVGVLAECRDPRRQDPADSEISPAMTV
jgi:diguanylate cyclase (GGDEF)-like protein/PAS domain S-box-containing protein